MQDPTKPTVLKTRECHCGCMSCTYLTDLMCEHHTECRACLESSFLGSPNPGGTVQFSQLVRDADSSTCMVGLGFQPSVAQLNGQLVTHIPHPAVHDATAGVHLGARRQRPGHCLKSNNKAANTAPSSCRSRHKARSISQTHSGAEVIAELLRVVLGTGVRAGNSTLQMLLLTLATIRAEDKHTMITQDVTNQGGNACPIFLINFLLH